MLVPVSHLEWQHTPGDSTTCSHHCEQLNSRIWDKGKQGNRTKMRFWDRLATGGWGGWRRELLFTAALRHIFTASTEAT